MLDNFEQVIEAASIVAELLAADPNLSVVATSRAALHVYGEREYPVPPLGLPDLARLPQLDALRQYEAVALFVERARRCGPTSRSPTRTRRPWPRSASASTGCRWPSSWPPRGSGS